MPKAIDGRPVRTSLMKRTVSPTWLRPYSERKTPIRTPTGTASSNLNPAAGGSATTSTAVSGGKYVAEGVYVGATQGLTAQSSKLTVEIEVRPHVTVQTDINQTTGTGIGLNYKFDY